MQGSVRASKPPLATGTGHPRPYCLTSDLGPVTLPSHVDHLVVGAGFAGVALAIGLQDDREEFVVIDKADGLGGTWWANTYRARSATCRASLQLLVRAQPRLEPYVVAPGRDPGVRREGRRRSGVLDRFHFGVELLGAAWDDDAAGGGCAPRRAT